MRRLKVAARASIGRLAWASFRHSKRVRGPFEDIQRFRKLEPDAQHLDLLRRLRETIDFFSRYAFANQEWESLARIQDPIEFAAAWRGIPILTKADLRTKFSPAVLAAAGLSGQLLSSSGSTGEPTSFLHDRRKRAYISATNLLCKFERGWKPGIPIVGIWGSPRDLGLRQRPAALFTSWVRGMHLIGAYDLGPHTLDRLAELTAQMPQFALYGFPTMLEYLAAELIRRGDHSLVGRVKVAWMGGETLTQEQAGLFRRAFGVPLLNHYGGRELSAMASQQNEGEPLEVMRPSIIIELLDDNNRPVSPGTPGRVVVSSLINRGTPFLRYEIGDLAVSNESPGPFGVTSLSTIIGRTTEVINLPSGKSLHGIFWYGIIRKYPEIISFQVRWKPNSIKILIVAPHFSRSRMQGFECDVRSNLDGFPSSFDYVGSIPRTKEGKILRIVREEDSE